MSFTQIEFLSFLAVFLPLYYALLSRLALQNFLVLVASVIFYAWWSKPMVLLILAVSLIGYFGAIAIERWQLRKTAILWAVTILLLSILGYYKYANFFIEGFVNLASYLGLKPSSVVLEIILPIGISFHIFQTLAYVVDVSRSDYVAERNFLRFTAFTMFFPQLVAGPIERAHDLLPQFSAVRKMDRKLLGHAFHLIVFGYFFKIFVADSAAEIVNVAFRADQPSGWWTVLGTLAFGLQIYGDFLGYSMIAKGVAALLGFELTWNFAHPYWATSIREFWQRWHITLSRWLRDYLYIPLGGNRGGALAAPRNTLITMALGGLWHGANWTFIAWGVLHGLALAVYHSIGRRITISNIAWTLSSWVLTMGVVFVGWFLFRAKNWAELTGMTRALRNFEWYPAHDGAALTIIFLAAILYAYEYFERKEDDRYALLRLSPWLGALFYGAAIWLTLAYSSRAGSSFIYFQF